MVSQQATRFGGHRHCVSEYLSLVVKEQDSTWSSKSVISVISKGHDLKAHGMSF